MPFLLLLLLHADTATAQVSLISKLSADPNFQCRPQDGSYVCVTKAPIHSSGFNYAKPVAIVIPQTEPPVNKPDNVMLHLQGFRGYCAGGHDVAYDPWQTLKEFNIPQQFVASVKTAQRPNSIMVFPISTGEDVDYQRQLEGHFDNIAAWVDGLTGSDANSAWHISGHSGAGSIIVNGLANSRVLVERAKSALLMDATYGAKTDLWTRISKKNSAIAIQSVYQGGSSRQWSSLQMQKVLNTNHTFKTPVTVVRSADRHCNIPNQFYRTMLEHALGPPNLNPNPNLNPKPAPAPVRPPPPAPNAPDTSA
jgi:hypothetical protein